jgi:protein-S-isoprenylcysteine O-methyltransferase Ste14
MEARQFFTIFVLIFIILSSIERLWWTFFKVKEKELGEVKAKWSLSVMSISHSIIIIGSIVEYFIIKRKIIFLVTILGICIFIVAFWLRRLSAKTLGEYHSLHVEIRKAHRLIKDGPYKYMRHPWYLSIILEVLSITLVLNVYYSFLFAVLVYIPILLVRVHFEEKAMIAILGDEYIEYKKKLWAFFPFKRNNKRF